MKNASYAVVLRENNDLEVIHMAGVSVTAGTVICTNITKRESRIVLGAVAKALEPVEVNHEPE